MIRGRGRRGNILKPALQQYGRRDDKFRERDVFSPDTEEFRQELCDLFADAGLVDTGAEVGFRCAEGGCEVERFEGGGLRRLLKFGGGENFEEGGCEGDVGVCG